MEVPSVAQRAKNDNAAVDRPSFAGHGTMIAIVASVAG